MPPDTTSSASASAAVLGVEASNLVPIAPGNEEAPVARTGASTSQEQEKEQESAIRFSRKFACSLCGLEFKESAQQRVHMRGDWHVYNLKRKMLGLEGLSEEAFGVEMAVPSASKKRGDVLRAKWEKEVRDREVVEEEEDLSETDEDEDEEDEEDEDEDGDSDEEDWSDEESDDSDDADELAMEVPEGDELRLSSGKVIGKKSTIVRHRKPLQPPNQSHTRSNIQPHPQPETSSETTTTTTNPPSNELNPSLLHTSPLPDPSLNPQTPRTQDLALRNTLGTLGLTPHQRSALIKAEKTMVSLDMRRRAVVERRVAFAGNKDSQKRYRIGGSRGGKKMGGLEKRNG